MTTDANSKPATIAYYYKVRWGHHDEWLDLFKRNHLPVLREGMREGKMLDVKLYQPRFHGDGNAAWDVLVTITYRDWAAIEEHTDEQLTRRLFPDHARHVELEQRRFDLLDAHWDVPLEELDLEA